MNNDSLKVKRNSSSFVPPPAKSNGRVDISNDAPHLSFPMSEPSNAKVEFSARTIQTSNALTDTYFSKANVNILQNALRKSIFEQTSGKHVIDRQSDVELQIVMRSIFLQYAKNNDDDIATQVKDLNHRVLEFCVPRVLSNLLQYIQYKKDVSVLPIPLRNAVNPSMKGDKSLMLNQFF